LLLRTYEDLKGGQQDRLNNNKEEHDKVETFL
jgi:C4-type Zn-finger protein